MKKILVLVITLFLPLSLFVNYRVFADYDPSSDIQFTQYFLSEQTFDMVTKSNNQSAGLVGYTNATAPVFGTMYYRYNSNSDNYTGNIYLVSSGTFEIVSTGNSVNNKTIGGNTFYYGNSNRSDGGSMNYNAPVYPGSQTANISYGYAIGYNYQSTIGYVPLYLEEGESFQTWVGASDPYTITVTSGNCYCGALVSGSSLYLCFANTEPFTVTGSRGNTNLSFTSDSNSGSYLGQQRVYVSHQGSSWSYSPNTYTYNFPVVNTNFSREEFGKFLIGAGIRSHGAPDPINYGSLITGFTTNFVATQNPSVVTMGMNQDVIQWKLTDTNGNTLLNNNKYVQIKAVPVEWSSATEEDLITQLKNDARDILVNVDPITVPASDGEFRILWQEVAEYLETDTLSEFIAKLFPYTYNGVWYKRGWYYQVRLVVGEDYTSPDYVGPWQVIYNGTSIDVDDDLTIINNTGIDPDLIEALQNLNTVNNTTNNYYYGDTIIYTGSDGEGEGFLTALVKAIQQLLSDIIKFLGDLFGSILDGLVDLILGLFDNIDIVGTFADWFTRLKEFFDNLDLTLPQFELPDPEVLEGFGELIPATLSIFSGSGLGFVIWVPLILVFLRIVL